MKNTIKTIAIALAAFGMAGTAAAQVSAGAYAEAHIITPLTITKTVDMDFGNVAVINSPGTIVLGTDGSRLGTGGATPVTNPSGTVTAAEFDITGTPNTQVVVTLPPDAPIPVRVYNGAVYMDVTNFISNPVSGFLIPGGGSLTLEVGATLNTAANQAVGTYHTQSDFVVTINYQ